MTIDLFVDGTLVGLSGSLATGLSLQGNEQLQLYDAEADNTTIYTGAELDISTGSTAQNTSLFGGEEDISGLSVDTTAYAGLQYVSGRAVGATITSGAEQYLDNDFSGTATDTVLMDGGFQEDFAVATGTTIFSGGVQWVQSTGSASATTIEAGGVQVAWGTVTGSVIDAGGLLVDLPGAVITGTTIKPGASSVSSGIAVIGGTLPFYTESFAASRAITGETTYIMQDGTAAGFTFAGGNAEVFAGGTLAGGVLENHAQVVIAAGGTALDSQIGSGVEAVNGYSDGETVLSQGLLELGGTAVNLLVTSGGTVTGAIPGGGSIVNVIVQAGGTVIAGTIDQAVVQAGGVIINAGIGNVTLNGGYAELNSLSGTALLGDNSTLSFGLLFGGGSLTTAPGTVSFAGSNAELYVNEGCASTDNLNIFTVSGFSETDTIMLDGISFASASFVAGTGLELNAGFITETIYFDHAFNPADLTIALGSLSTEITICYLAGTRILTQAGEIMVEDLRPGAMVLTRFSGFQPIKWIGRQSYARRFISRDRRPVRIAAGALGPNMPAAPLYVSPGHSMLIGNTLLLAKNLVNGITIEQPDALDDVEYYSIEMESHDCVLANHAWSESFADGPGLRNQFHNHAEFHARFPDYRAPETLRLCAARPEAGAELEAALWPIISRIQATPGPLHGHIDMLGPDRIEGWAWDPSHPDLPVRLEIRMDDKVLGMALACHYRCDLAGAGLGRGHCMFSFALPNDISAPITIRRAADGMELGQINIGQQWHKQA